MSKAKKGSVEKSFLKIDIISWKCKKENPAGMRYDKIIKNLKGKRNSCEDYWEYKIENI
jgi:hypothetical protein